MRWRLLTSSTISASVSSKARSADSGSNASMRRVPGEERVRGGHGRVVEHAHLLAERAQPQGHRDLAPQPVAVRVHVGREQQAASASR